MALSNLYTTKINITLNPDFIHRTWRQSLWDEKYGEVLGEVKMKQLEVPVISKGKFGLVIDGPWRGYKVRVVGYRGQVLPRSTQYTYEVKAYNINDIPNFNKIELAIPLEDLVPYTRANILLYGL